MDKLVIYVYEQTETEEKKKRYLGFFLNTFAFANSRIHEYT